VKINVKWSDQLNSLLGHNNSVATNGLQTPSKHYTINVIETWDVSCLASHASIGSDARNSFRYFLDFHPLIPLSSITPTWHSINKKAKKHTKSIKCLHNYVTKHKTTCYFDMLKIVTYKGQKKEK